MTIQEVLVNTNRPLLRQQKLYLVAMDIDDGGFASIFFSGKNPFDEYIRGELRQEYGKCSG